MHEFLCRKFIFAVTSICIGSAFQHGFHTGITNVPEEMFRRWFKKMRTKRLMGITPSEKEITMIWSTTIATFSLGGMLGGALIGYFSDRFGRKKSLMMSNAIIVLALVLMIFSKQLNSVELFIFGRFLAGISSGLSAGICLIYLIEISPDKIRGAVGTCYQIGIILGIQVSQIDGVILGNEDQLVYIFIMALFPTLLQVVFLPFCPESPRYLLMTKDDEKAARRALAWLRGTNDVDTELESLKQEDSLVKSMHTTMLKRVVNNQSRRTGLATCLVLNIGQQMCGINAIIYFSTETFRDLGMDFKIALWVTVGATTVITITTIITLFLIDTIGRRKLLLASFLGMAITTTVLSYALIAGEKKKISSMTYLVGTFSCLYFMAFSLGAGAIPWFISAEVFNYTARSVTVSATVFVNWFANFLISQTFLPLRDAIGYYVFVIFVILDCFFFCFCLHCPETSRLSAIEIIEMYNK